jgi:ADP-ribose pyrophosphatase
MRQKRNGITLGAHAIVSFFILSRANLASQRYARGPARRAFRASYHGLDAALSHVDAEWYRKPMSTRKVPPARLASQSEPKRALKSSASQSKIPALPAAAVRKPAASKSKATVIDSKLAFQGKVFSVTTDTVTEPGGVTSIRDVIRHNGSVVVLAVDASRNARDPIILLERQYRHAAGQFLLELPAGRIEPGETALAAAKRELIEETGFRARRWSHLVRYFASPGFLAEFMQVYLAEDIMPGIAQPEPDEKIELLHLPLSEVMSQIHSGKIHDGKTILSVLLYASNRSSILKQ